MTNLTQQEDSKEVPGTLKDGFFDWAKRNEPKIRWHIDKAKKKFKGKVVVVLSPDLNGFCQMISYDVKTKERLFAYFAAIEDTASVAEMNQFIKDRLNLGAVLIKDDRVIN